MFDHGFGDVYTNFPFSDFLLVYFNVVVDRDHNVVDSVEEVEVFGHGFRDTDIDRSFFDLVLDVDPVLPDFLLTEVVHHVVEYFFVHCVNDTF